MLLLQAAAAGGGEELLRAEIAAGIEGVVQIFHRREIAVIEHLLHEVNLLNTYPVFASHRAAALQTLFQNLVTGDQDPAVVFESLLSATD